MTAGQKTILIFLLLLLAIALLSYLPAVGPVHWFLRVGVPEIGMPLILPPAFLATVWLGRWNPLVSALLFSLLASLLFAPWLRALAVASDIKDNLGPFDHCPQRYPLLLGEQIDFVLSTENYTSTLQWDRYEPVASRASIVFVHGGSWRNGARQDYPQLFRYLAGRGYRVLSITYTLSGTAPYPAAPDDVAAALNKAKEFEQPVFLMGRSSGGHLALLTAYTHAEEVAGVVAIYPPVDMLWSYDNPSNPSVLNSKEAIVEFLGAIPAEDPELYRQASPIFQVGKTGPATLLIHGGSDSLVYLKQSRMLSEKLDHLGVPRALLTLPWAEHGGDITIYGPTGRLGAWAIESFLESRLADL